VTLACAPPTPPIVAVLRAAGQVFMRRVGERRGLVMVFGPCWPRRARPRFVLVCTPVRADRGADQGQRAGLRRQPLSTIAHSLHVSENTVRSHLKQIFHKTNTHGQMDLVHLHARVCLTLL